MKRVIIIVFAYFFAHAVAQQYQELQNVEDTPSVTENIRPSMLSMLSKYVEINGTIDEVMKGSMTESYGGVWLNSTQSPASGLCEMEETYVEEVSITDRVPYDVEVEIWCWSIRCTEWETRYREDVRQENVTKIRLVHFLNL